MENRLKNNPNKKKSINLLVPKNLLTMNWKLTAIKVVLGIVIVILIYLVVDSILTPLRFNAAVEARSSKVIQNLKDIRSGQQFYKQFNNKYSGDFDTLIDFLRTSEIPIVNKIPDPTDTTFTKTINDTVGYVKVADSLYRMRKNFTLDSLKYIPFSGGKKFELEASTIQRGGVVVPVYEVKAHYSKFLSDLDNQLTVNLIKSRQDIERYPGLKVGSMEEPSTDGNWE